jgi:hypothetical protein
VQKVERCYVRVGLPFEFGHQVAINVGPEKPDDIETILSGLWLILINYRLQR